MSAVADVFIVEIFDKEGFFLVARNVFTSGDLIVPGLWEYIVWEDVLNFGWKGGIDRRNIRLKITVKLIHLGFLFLLLDEGLPFFDHVRKSGFISTSFDLFAVAAALKTHGPTFIYSKL